MRTNRGYVPAGWHLITNAGESVAVTQSPVSIGRDAGCHVQCADVMLSRRHAVVQQIEGRLQIADGASTNGTFVNGVRIFDRRRLLHGDIIELGSLRLLVINTLRPDPPLAASCPGFGVESLSGGDISSLRPPFALRSKGDQPSKSLAIRGPNTRHIDNRVQCRALR